ncbi:hypothetical protein PFISCL1PPCAC_21829 [Pristionchus fissidentatus]|uniref:Saposin B-type domain-containing protein n=1 Tax=Pristionchus fissidentatus TaxID=1538716 RepID=A0AAV5WF70_9BILA|nr:hypothetical protein PFISCL1PPCAC_21829 [Pristionchus fissidentatus]
MNRLSTVVLMTLVAITVSLPIIQLDDEDNTQTTPGGLTFDEFCEQCVDFFDFFLSNIGEEEAVFEAVCNKIMHNSDENFPMMKVCVAGFVGEMFYVKKRLITNGEGSLDICMKLGCTYPAVTAEPE